MRPDAMARNWFLRPFRRIVIGVVLVLCLPLVNSHFLSSVCPTGFANFGDSLTDTGGALDAFPYYQDPENLPYGETFFGRPAKRYCNGRLVPDFFSQAFRKDLLDSYFSVTTFEYGAGINFAQAGATAVQSSLESNPFSFVPFQIGQFFRFINSVAAAQRQPSCLNFLPSEPMSVSYKSWLYTIEIGGNDLLNALRNGSSASTIENSTIPAAVTAIEDSIQVLYKAGARQFLIFGIPALGCSTIVITLYGADKDDMGCNDKANKIALAYNARLLTAVRALRRRLKPVSIAYFDYYGANLEILRNPTNYGFNPALIFTACCGAPGDGQLNYNPNVTCGRPGSDHCPNPDEHVNWDGIHFTEAFYRVISTFALTSKFTDGGLNYSAFCHLDFSKFGSSVKFRQAYPFSCTTTFS